MVSLQFRPLNTTVQSRPALMVMSCSALSILLLHVTPARTIAGPLVWAWSSPMVSTGPTTDAHAPTAPNNSTKSSPKPYPTPKRPSQTDVGASDPKAPVLPVYPKAIRKPTKTPKKNLNRRDFY
ncbi:hypothetical protein K470DRAFT_258405 [Piedraia hortae CBS 480.64]|uniref:Uncharacterized protein n=1 Tax=Piedraia hortae CBS 480.64 TaxID=1314780 RepID=A0A6A7BXC4_9PEZI|nr:hypothetical protein K470DRAFT_258405 [Piedraia hortae CBS 480.64]